MKVAIVGPEAVIMPFGAIGADIFPAGEDVDTLLKEIITKGYGIIFITEDTVSRLKDRSILECEGVNIVPIPGAGGETGFGSGRIRDLIKKAVGVDLGGER